MEGAAPAVLSTVIDTEVWPSEQELEKWLMNTVKDADCGVAFLRQCLQMNPAYGSYLAGDKDLAGIVQLFAKRLKARMVASKGPVQPSALYEPLCEMAWRVTGHVFHAILDLGEADHRLGLPKEPLGQVKMLVQTNMELSKKLNSMRRDYLRELSHHRDRERTLSEKSQQVVSDLQENPVMFFEPLKFVLDDATKEFVRAVVEERVKLEQKSPPRPIVKEEPEVQEVVVNVDDEEMRKLQSELKMLKQDLAKEKMNCKKLEANEEKLKSQIEEAQQQAQAYKEQVAKARADMEGFESDEIKRLRAMLDEKEKEISELAESLHSNGEEAEALQAKKLAKSKEELHQAKETIKGLEAEMSSMSSELAELKAQLEEAFAKLGDQADEMKKARSNRTTKEVKKEVTKTVESVVADPEVQKQLEQSLQVEKELREANRQLERALEEERKKRSLTTNKGDDMVKVVGDGGKEAKAALDKMKKEYAKREKEQEEEIARLREAIEALQKGEEPKVEIKKVVGNPDSEAAAKSWQKKFESMRAEKEDFENKNANLQQQVAILMEKLKEYGGEKALKEVEQVIKLTPAVIVRKPRKKNAWERLYEDAQRRIQAMRMRAENMEREQQEQLRFWMSRAMNPQSVRILENLTHLQKAAAATQNRFVDAMAKFNDDYPMETQFPDDGRAADGIFSRRPAAAPQELSPRVLTTQDPHVLKTELARMHRENQFLHGENDLLRAQMFSDVDLMAGITGHALLPSAMSRGRGDLAMGHQPRHRSDSDSPPVRSRSPEDVRARHQGPYMSPQDRPLPKPGHESEEKAPQRMQYHQQPQAPQRPDAHHGHAYGHPQDLLQSRAVVGVKGKPGARPAENMRRAMSDLNSDSARSGRGMMDTDGVFSMTAPMPRSSSSRREGSSPPRVPRSEKSHQQLEAVPPWRRKPTSRTSSDLAATAPEHLGQSSRRQGAGRVDNTIGAALGHPPGPPGPPPHPASMGSAGGASRSPPPASSAVPGRPPVVGTLQPIEARALEASDRSLSPSGRRLLTPSNGEASLHSRSSPQLASLAVTMPAGFGAELGGAADHAQQDMHRAMAATMMPQRPRQIRQGRYTSTDWNAAPVKPMAKDMCVTPMRSQQWMSGHG